MQRRHSSGEIIVATVHCVSSVLAVSLVGFSRETGAPDAGRFVGVPTKPRSDRGTEWPIAQLT